MSMTDVLEAEHRTGRIKLHGPDGFEGMRKAGKLAAECLDMLIPHVQPGVVTDDLDRLAREFILDTVPCLPVSAIAAIPAPSVSL